MNEHKRCKLPLWRDVMMQFQKTTHYEGVFYRCGYRNLFLGYTIIRNGNKFTEFDILAVKDDKTCVNLELTTNESKDADEQLQRQSSVTPSEIGQFIGVDVNSNPNSILATNVSLETKYCKLFFGESVRAYNTEQLTDKCLKNGFDTISGSIPDAPSTPFTLVPDMNIKERREGISSVLLQILYSGEGKKVEDILANGFDYLWDRIDPVTRSNLVNCVS